MAEQSLGILELRSISKGYEMADVFLKAGNVTLFTFRPTCPGKFLIILQGASGELTSAMQDAKEKAGKFHVSSYILHIAHEELLAFLNNKHPKVEVDAVGIIEISQLGAGLNAVNEALKKSAIHLKRMTLGASIGGKFVAVFTGEVSAIQEGMRILIETAEPKKVIHHTVIPSPDELLKRYL
ncbi:ethanolamine utilization microcompartment shell protein [Listeria monocytogenes]|uniref:ethanolamine utilization microcompartment shell protein n=1 Tax=Listeria monocytogenes TaxID=1639 RepID=UPI003593FC7A